MFPQKDCCESTAMKGGWVWGGCWDVIRYNLPNRLYFITSQQFPPTHTPPASLDSFLNQQIHYENEHQSVKCVMYLHVPFTATLSRQRFHGNAFMETLLWQHFHGNTFTATLSWQHFHGNALMATLSLQRLYCNIFVAMLLREHLNVQFQ